VVDTFVIPTRYEANCKTSVSQKGQQFYGRLRSKTVSGKKIGDQCETTPTAEQFDFDSIDRAPWRGASQVFLAADRSAITSD
jgi:hypothetical protein